MYMFLKQERPEVDDFERKKKTLAVKEKYVQEYIRQNVYNGNSCKNFNIFFSTILKKYFEKMHFLPVGGVGVEH